MEARKQELRLNKRPSSSELENKERPKKRPTMQCVKIEDSGDGRVEKLFKFRVLFPNGMSVGLKIRDPEAEWPMEMFVNRVKDEYFRAMRETESQKQKRRIDWKSQDLHFVDANDNVMKRRISFRNLKPDKYHLLRLHDGSKEAETYENMWDLTPDTDLLMELPEEYNFETALADLIDNSLQAVWSNGANERRLVSVEVNKDRITIFDTGPGMDGTDERSIVKWGKMGASLHRSSRQHGIGGKPPYLTPVFGMFGYGGPIASMHLGRHALVSSKTKESKKVYTLHLEREALLSRSGSEKTWRTDGGIRKPRADEIKRSPQGSFTKVEIFEPKMKDLDIVQLCCKLKDIYFPYIQCDEVSNTCRTIRPVEFQVNEIDLAEIQGGEVAITNLHSCNGPEFVLQLRFCKETSSLGLSVSQEANARLRFIYFPIVEGKESIDRLLEKMNAEGCGIRENFESFSRVSIWRLGRLLPDARWKRLPFMEPRKKVGDKAQILKTCCLRVKCFIDTDAGFNPTPSKTDLAHHHPCTTILRNFGEKSLDKDKEVHLEISKDGKQVALSLLEKQYEEWLFQMHDRYDEVIERGEDQPLLVVSPLNKKKLAISSDVLRVHKEIQRKGASWKSGQKIKVLKGACAGCHKNNMYATLECIVLEGFQGDSGGEARVICSPLGLPSENSCLLSVHDDGNTGIDIRGSISLPISVIDSGKCVAMETAEWEYQVLKRRQKMPSSIEILSARHCQELGVDGALPTESTVYAGHVPPKEIVAVIRPASFNSGSVTKNLDQKHIVITKEDLEMGMQIKFRAEDKSVKDVCHIYSGYIKPSSRKSFQGLYVFPVGHKFPSLFEKAGDYTFSFSIRESSIGICERRVQVKALSKVGSWRQSCDRQAPPFKVRVGLCFPPFSIACYDVHGNRIAFASVPEVMIKIISGVRVLANVNKMKLDLSSDKLTLRIKDALVECYELDRIKPGYEATLIVSRRDGLFPVSFPCQVLPGTFHSIMTQPRNLDQQLLPGHAIREFVLEILDAYGNHVDGGLEFLLDVDGFSFEDHIGSIRKVDQRGCVDLSGLLRVTGGYGRKLLISEQIVFKKEFETEKRELRALSKVPEFCVVGSVLENMAFVVINTEGEVDETIHDDESCGQSHMLMIKSESLDTDDSVKYSFHHGRCIVRAISLPQKEGLVRLVASHSRYQELYLTIEVHVMQAPLVERETTQTPYTDGKVFLLQDSSALKASKVDGVDGQYSDGKLLLLQDSSAAKDIQGFVVAIMNDQKELEKELFEYGSRVGGCEKALERLREELSILQASSGLDLPNHSGSVIGKEALMKLIESKGDSAAAVVCRLLNEIPSPQQDNNVIENILGVVALLGTVQTNELSRVLAEYLGADQMLAVVCKSYAAVDALENYEQNRKVDRAHGLHPVATKLAPSISGRYVVICLEDTRPYIGKLGSDPDRKLALPDPALPNGNTPSGYLGYAVNLVNLESHHLQTRTDAGHGLRETLFYCLFGKIQVYKTREDMKMAKACIKNGAVSLDGGIMRGNGVLSLGNREPEICFPVIAHGSKRHSSPQCTRLLRQQIEEKELKVKETLALIKKVTKTHKKTLKRFRDIKDRYMKFLDQKGPLLRGL